MKTIGKKFSFITKVFLVLGLIFSNLSSLSIVFAYEATDDFTVMLVDDNKIKVNYLEELDATDVVKVEISENYTYLNNTPEGILTDSLVTTGDVITSELGFEFVSSMLSSVIFDGLYEVSVSLYNETDALELGTVIYSENIEHDSGLEVLVTDSLNNVISKTNGVYNTVDGIVLAKSKILAGGLMPSVVYTYDELQYTANSLMEVEIEDALDVSGRLYGEYKLPIEAVVTLDTLEEMVFDEELTVMYKSYADNTIALNNKLNEIIPDSSYLFEGESKDGILYVMPNETDTHSVLDMIKVLDAYVMGNDKITYDISNSEYESFKDAYAAYLETVLPEEEIMTVEEFYKDVRLDDTTVITLSSEGQTVTYKVVIFADLNNDGLLTEEDLLKLIEQSVDSSLEVNLDKSDMNDDEIINIKDAVSLYNTLNTGLWNEEVLDTDGTLDARLEVVEDDIVSGDTFSVDYILTLEEYKTNGMAGLVEYDKELLELVSITNKSTWIGSNKDGKFLYLGEEVLQGVKVEDDSVDAPEIPEGDEIIAVEGEEEENPVVTYEGKEYVVLTLTFKALKSGSALVQVTDLAFVDGMSLLDTEGMEVKTEVIINKSSDNTLASLTVAGQVIELVEGVLEYTINVDNETTEALVEAITNNIAANVSSIIVPEELAEGENTITIIVAAENGDELVYTVKVVREEKEEETTTYTSYQQPTYEEEEEEVVTSPVVDNEEEEEAKDDDKEESKLSRIIIIILILLVVAGLIYLIFKDDADEESKKVNKDINRLRKENDFKESNNNNTHNNSNHRNNNKGKNNKKGR